MKIGRRRIVYTFGNHGPLWFDCPSCIRSGNNDDNSLTGIFANDVIPLSARGRLVDTWKPEFWNAWRHSYNGSLTTRHLSCSYSRQMTLRRLPAERERIRPTFQPFVHRSRFSFLFYFATTQILEINKKRRRRKKYSLIFLYLSPKLRAMKNNFLSKIREMRVLEKIQKMWILFSRRLKLYRFSFRQSSAMNYRKINY